MAAVQAHSGLPMLRGSFCNVSWMFVSATTSRFIIWMDHLVADTSDSQHLTGLASILLVLPLPDINFDLHFLTWQQWDSDCLNYYVELIMWTWANIVPSHIPAVAIVRFSLEKNHWQTAGFPPICSSCLDHRRPPITMIVCHVYSWLNYFGEFWR